MNENNGLYGVPAPPLDAIGPRCRASKARGGVGSILESAPEIESSTSLNQCWSGLQFAIDFTA